MFSFITNIYNNKTKGPTLMELFTATEKMEKFFFDNYKRSMFAPRVTRHTSIRYSSSCHTRVNMGASIFFTAAMTTWFLLAQTPSFSKLCIPRTNGLLCRRVLCVRCTVTTDLLVWYSNTKNDLSLGAAIFSLHTLASPSGRNANYDEKQLTGGETILELFLLSVRVSWIRVLRFSYNKFS